MCSQIGKTYLNMSNIDKLLRNKNQNDICILEYFNFQERNL